jgi:hypothetical protein
MTAAERAVAISIKTAEDMSLHTHIKKQGGRERPLYTTGVHKDFKDGAKLYQKGKIFSTRAIHAAKRADEGG